MTRKHTRTKRRNANDTADANREPVGDQADGHSPAQSAEYRPDDPTRGGATQGTNDTLDKMFGLGKEGAQQRPNEPGDKPPTEAERKAYLRGRFWGLTRGASVGMEIGMEIGSTLARRPLLDHINKLNRRLGRAGQRVAIMRRLLVDQASVNADTAAVLFD